MTNTTILSSAERDKARAIVRQSAALIGFRHFTKEWEPLVDAFATALSTARREASAATWEKAIALVQSFESGTEIRKTKGFKFKLPYTKEVAHVIVKELQAASGIKKVAALERAAEGDK